MKKMFCAACVMTLLCATNAFGACTMDDFQKEMAVMQASIMEFGKDPDKMTKISATIEKEYSAEMTEFVKIAESAAGDADKLQAMLDKGCELYNRINKTLDSYK